MKYSVLFVSLFSAMACADDSPQSWIGFMGHQGSSSVTRDVSDQSGADAGTVIAYGKGNYTDVVFSVGHYLTPNIAVELQLARPNSNDTYHLNIVDNGTALQQKLNKYPMSTSMEVKTEVEWMTGIYTQYDFDLGAGFKVYPKVGYSWIEAKHSIISLPGNPGTAENDHEFSWGGGVSWDSPEVPVKLHVEWLEYFDDYKAINAGIKVLF